MFCKNCGKQSDGTKKFCSGCGTAFPSAQKTEVKATAAVSVVRSPMPKEPWTTERIIKTVLVVIFVGGLILLKIGWVAFSSVDNSAVEKNNAALDDYNSGNNEQAIIGFKQAADDAVTNTNKINTLKNLAYVYTSEQKDFLALQTFQEALPLASINSFDYHLISGEIALLQGRPESALFSFNKALALEPNDFQINNTLNLFYLDIDGATSEYLDYPKALVFALKAYNNDPEKSSAATQNLGIAYFYNDQYDNSITYFKMTDANKDPYIALWLGLAYAMKDQPVTAKYYFNIAIGAGIEIPEEVTEYMYSN